MKRIPKKIHCTWFSTDPFPDEVQKCIESWREFLPDYEFICWDYSRVKNIENTFLQEALQEKKWAFAADFVRLYAIYHQGGIYLDTDVMLFKNFENFKDDSCFIGRENSFHKIMNTYCVFLSSHCFGAIPGNAFIKSCLDYYQNRHFILSNNENLHDELRYDQKTLPYIQAVLAKDLGFDWLYRSNIKMVHPDLTIYPSYYFDAVKLKNVSVCRHLALGNWRNEGENSEEITLTYKLEWRMIKVLDVFLRRFYYMIVKL